MSFSTAVDRELRDVASMLSFSDARRVTCNFQEVTIKVGCNTL